MITSHRPPPHPIDRPLRNSKSQEDLLGTPLKPEITGLFTPPRRLASGRFSESDLKVKNKPRVPHVKITEVSLGDSISVPKTSSLKTKVQTLPADMRDFSAKSLRKEGSRSAEPPNNNNGYHDDSRLQGMKIKSASPSIKPRRQHGHSKSQSLGTKYVSMHTSKSTPINALALPLCSVLTALGIANSRPQGNGRLDLTINAVILLLLYN